MHWRLSGGTFFFFRNTKSQRQLQEIECCFPGPSLSLLPLKRVVSCISLPYCSLLCHATCHNSQPYHRLTTMESGGCGLKPVNSWAKLQLAFFNLFKHFPVMRSLTNTDMVSVSSLQTVFMLFYHSFLGSISFLYKWNPHYQLFFFINHAFGASKASQSFIKSFLLSYLIGIFSLPFIVIYIYI